MKTRLFVLLAGFLAFAGCAREEIVLPLDSASEGSEMQSGEVHHGMIVLGAKLEDPYSLDVVRTVLAARYPTKVEREAVMPTNLYVRFLPASEEQFQTLESLGLELLDHPVDYEIIREGDYYHDPEVEEGEITWQYAVVEPDFKFPKGIRYEVLDECFISENAPLTRAFEGVDWEEVEREAYRITGNESLLQPDTKAGKNHPSGRITIVDDRYRDGEPIGVKGVKVSVNAFVKFSSAYTDEDGRYEIPKTYNSNVRYRLVFRNRKGFGIGLNLLLVQASVSTLGKNSPEGLDVRIDNASDRHLFCRSVVNNAAWDYYEMCSKYNLRTPPANLRIWLFQLLNLSSTPMLQHGPVLDMGLFSDFLGVYRPLIQIFLPDITLGVRDLTDYSSIYSLACHELSHASHYMKVGNDFWDNYILYVVTSYVKSGGILYGTGEESSSGYCAVGEMWAYYMQNMCYNDRYGVINENIGSGNWFFPQILMYLDERGLGREKIFRAMEDTTDSAERLREKLLDLYPEMKNLIMQAFERYNNLNYEK